MVYLCCWYDDTHFTIVDYYYSIFGEKANVTEEECANYLRDKAKELKLIQTKLNQIGKGRLYQQLIDNIDRDLSLCRKFDCITY